MEKKFCFRSLNFIIKPLWGHDGLICLLHTCVPEARTRAVCCSLNDTPLLLQCFAVVVHKLYKLNQCAYKRFWHIISCRPHAAAQIVVMRPSQPSCLVADTFGPYNQTMRKPTQRKRMPWVVALLELGKMRY